MGIADPKNQAPIGGVGNAGHITPHGAGEGYTPAIVIDDGVYAKHGSPGAAGCGVIAIIFPPKGSPTADAVAETKSIPITNAISTKNK